MIRVGLLWHSLSSGNLGVRALTLAQLSILEAAAAAAGRSIEVAMFGHPDWGAPPLSFEGQHVRLAGSFDLTAAALFRRPMDVLSAFRRCDLLIDIGEGDSFTDVYGTRRYLKQIASKALALRSGRPLILAPQTIGPFGCGRRLPAGAILRGAAEIFVRDEESERFTRRISRRCNPVVSTDIAFLLPWTKPPHRAPDDSVRIGINVSGLLYGSPSFGLSVSYDRLIDALLARFTANPVCEVHLVGHVLAAPGDPDQDIAVADALARRFPALKVAPPSSDPRAVKALIAGFDFFVGARMHACIAAFSAGIPVVPLAYTRKTTGLFRALGYDTVVDLRTSTLDAAVATVTDAYVRRVLLAEQVAAGNAEAAVRLKHYTDAIGRMVSAA